VGSGLPVFGHIEFSGSYDGKLEPSGRLIIPVPFRHAFTEGSAYLWPQPDVHVGIYTRLGFNETVDAQLAKVPADMLDPQLRIDIYSNAPQVPIDKQFRLVIPPAIRELVPLGEEIVFAGSIESIRVMTRDTSAQVANKARMFNVMNQGWGGLSTKAAE